jgi:hypothetical protein
MATAAAPHAIWSVARLAWIGVRESGNWRSQPGNCPATSAPRAAIAMPEENMRLKAKGRSASVVSPATAGDRQTAHEQRVMPVRMASPNCAGCAEKQVRAREKTTVHTKPVTSVRRRPKRWAQMPAGMVPRMLPNAINPPITPKERSFRWKPSR